MGLGLALARKHARAIGGTIDARSGPEGGAAFWLDCPLAAAPEDLGDASETVRVLVVDDHPTNRRIVELMLEDIAEVTAAEDGVEAVEAARHARFDVILMDIQMPRMDGITAVARIREDERATGRAPTPIIMLTANTQPEHMTASRAAGADRHLGKPFTAAGLISEIQNILT
jgi:CheY-like chemotaxis protein